ncbi:MAG: UbiD family decarboxylase [Clostridia bacterium]|nr:MAG: UbiD family decarboxylase [Clostridia bacterium]
MAFKDMRDWINKLEEAGQLKRITTEVDLDKEVGTIARKVFTTGGPALLFENIKGYQTTRCTKIFTGGLAARVRMALMLGLPPETKFNDIVQELRKRLKNPIPPVEVPTGPVKENIVRGDEVNLFEFPVPKWHPRDGGRYFSTWCAIITRDPDTGQLNAGLYRGQILDKNKIGVLLVGAQHWGVHFAKYRAIGKPMPVAIACGWDPVMAPVAACPVQNIDEFPVMGGLRGEAVELTRCETSDLMVPASAEIVVEGFISPDPPTYEVEGPFAEYTGYYGDTRKRPVIKVECITHRHDPIYRGSLEGQKPGTVGDPPRPNETSRIISAMVSALTWKILDEQGVPGILDLTAGTTTFVRIRKMYRGHAKQVAAALWGSSTSLYLYKNVVVVDEDIDIRDLRSLEWAFSYRVNAAEDDIVVFPGMPGSPLDPAIRYHDRNELEFGAGKWSRVLIDATKNWDYPRVAEWDYDRYPPLASDVDPESERLVEQRWAAYGL